MPDTMVRGGVTYTYLVDQVGSVRAIIDVATGTVVQTIAYNAWGEVLSDSAPGFQPFGYAGGLTDGDTGLVHFGAREYDPRTGTWISKDPIRLDGGLNVYGYVEGDCVNRIDPSGLIFDFGIDPGDSDPSTGAGAALSGAFCALFPGLCGEPSPPAAPTPPGPMCKADDSPGPTPKTPCSDQCIGYLGYGACYRGSDGWNYCNDLGGAHAFQRCVSECEGNL